MNIMCNTSFLNNFALRSLHMSKKKRLGQIQDEFRSFGKINFLSVLLLWTMFQHESKEHSYF